MFHRMLLSATAAKEPSLPIQILIILLCLSLPYLIRRKTGKSLGEWFGSLTLLGRLAKKKETKGDTTVGKTSQKAKALPAQESAQEEGEQQRKQKNAARDDWMKFVSGLLTFARKNKLFVMVPGNLQAQGKTAEFTAVLVTRARVIGILCYGFDGTVICRGGQEKWQQKRGSVTETMKSPLAEARENLPILQAALRSVGREAMPCEVMMVFTSRDVSFQGAVPEKVMKQDVFFQKVASKADVTSGTTEPKELGQALSKLLVKRGKRGR